MEKLRQVTIDEVRRDSSIFQQTKDYKLGICALVDIENMGYCRDGITRWYIFTLSTGERVIYFKY